MEKKKDPPMIAGILSGMLIFTSFVAFCMFMFWLCMQCTGTKI